MVVVQKLKIKNHFKLMCNIKSDLPKQWLLTITSYLVAGFRIFKTHKPRGGKRGKGIFNFNFKGVLTTPFISTNNDPAQAEIRN